MRTCEDILVLLFKLLIAEKVKRHGLDRNRSVVALQKI
jgi:hypothetical protein